MGEDFNVHVIEPEKANFNETEVTSATGKHPGSGEYPHVLKNSVLITDPDAFKPRPNGPTQKGPIRTKESVKIDVTTAVKSVWGKSNFIAFGLEAVTNEISRFCSVSRTKPRGTNQDAQGWCYPKLEILLGLGQCNVTTQDPSCSKPADSTPGPLDAMCGSTAPTFPGTPTDWRPGSAITTTTTTTTTTVAAPIKEGQCRYDDHVYCPWPNSDTMCSGDQCCPDQSTCPSSKFAQAEGCNLKKYDCTAPVPANWTCRETEEVFCPGTTDKCSGDTCCPNNTTCPSASVLQVPSCGSKAVDCQAPCQKTFLVPSESSSFALLLIRKMRSSLQHLRRSAQPTLSVQLWVSPANAAPPLKMVFSWIAAMVPPRTEMINALAISVALMEALAHRHHKPLLKVVAPKSKHVNC